jgi:thiosulfate/3-mercaptopyruvate sulfurtransferase
MEPNPLVSAAWLEEHRKDPNVVIADVRWYLTGRRGIDAYAAGHVPGAHFVDVDTDLASPPGPGKPGRHPLPDPATFAQVLRRIGAGPGTTVVAYDDTGGTTAARLWWLLRYFGVGGGRVLDGGLAAWTARGGALETNAPPARSAALVPLLPHPEMIVDKAAVVDLVARGAGLLLDARARERYEGRVEPVDPRPGHIPGAKSAPFSENLAGPAGAFLAEDELSRRYGALGVGERDPVVLYCGSGVTACHGLLALAVLGRDDARLYEGSWSEWSSDLALSAALGNS